MQLLYHVSHFSHHYVTTANITPSPLLDFMHSPWETVYNLLFFVYSGLNGTKSKRKDISMLEGHFIGSSPSFPEVASPLFHIKLTFLLLTTLSSL